jgi:hypothetical protein
MGDILRYLKCCKGDGTPRYPNLKQVFITTRTYGGYPNDPNHDACKLNPEPFSYETGFAVQRLIVAQINQSYGLNNNDNYSGPVKFLGDGNASNDTPWFDWGPYLWINGDQPRSDQLVWCKGQGNQTCSQTQRDVRDGDIFGDPITYWGDYTHPSAMGTQKVANQLVNFITGNLPFPQTTISQWVSWTRP